MDGFARASTTSKAVTIDYIDVKKKDIILVTGEVYAKSASGPGCISATHIK